MKKMNKVEFTKNRIFDYLDELYKNGFCDIASMPKFMHNEYRELTPQQIVKYVNDWLIYKKINHPQLKLKENK